MLKKYLRLSWGSAEAAFALSVNGGRAMIVRLLLGQFSHVRKIVVATPIVVSDTFKDDLHLLQTHDLSIVSTKDA